MRLRLQWLAGLGILFAPLTGSGCESIFPLVQLLGGSNLAGPLWLTHSLFWLAVAVTIKCGVFIFWQT